jgi:hypothetical protein
MTGDVSQPESDGGADDLGKIGSELRDQMSRLRERVTHERRKLEGRSFSASPSDDESER